MDGELIFAFVFAGCLLTVMVSWLVFGRMSMARIEKAIMAEGKPRPCSWDGVGGRLVWYAYAVALHHQEINPESSQNFLRTNPQAPEPHPPSKPEHYDS